MTATEISKLLANRIEDLCAHLLPNGENRGGEWCVGSLSGEPGGSLKIPLSGKKLGMFRDFAGADTDKGDLIGLWKSVRNVDMPTACREALEWLNVPQEQRNGYRMKPVSPSEPKPIDAHWTEVQSRLRKGTLAELQALSEQRKLGGTAGLERASAAGHLWFTDVYDNGERHPAWVLTDSARLNGQARKMDGTEWKFDGKKKPSKSKTLWSPEAGWPVGIDDATTQAIVLVEGNPDFLAAYQAIWMTGKPLSPVAVFGASTVICEEAVRKFAGKTVFIMAHSEESGVGLKSAQRWERQLKAVGATTTIHTFGQDGVKDLNDLLSLAVTQDNEQLITDLWPVAIVASNDDWESDPTPTPPPDRLDSKRIRLATKPPEPITRLFLNKKPIATPGNLVTLISKAKTGKTATIGAVVAAIIAAHHDIPNADTFGFTAPHNREAVVLIDTEQSPYDAFICHERALSRSTQSNDPDWLCHYALVGESTEQLTKDLLSILAKAKATHSGIFTIILDGVADFVNSVNDEAECNTFVTWLRAIAVEYDCPIICVIHSNEAQKSGDDGRGHLGKQLTRKAESNLLLKKTGDVTTITSEKQRKAPITEADNIAFRWSDQLGRHISCNSETGTGPTRKGRPAIHQLSKFFPFFPKHGDRHLPWPIIWNKAKELVEIPRNTFRDLCDREYELGQLDRVIDPNSGPCYRLKSVPGE